jgi:ABC-type thiamin/hydroxymethylpyrimidine transport system permease subunit
MNTIRIVITLFIAVLIAVSVVGWIWTSAHQPSSQATASHVVLGLGMLAGVVGVVAIWRDGSTRAGGAG